MRSTLLLVIGLLVFGIAVVFSVTALGTSGPTTVPANSLLVSRVGASVEVLTPSGKKLMQLVTPNSTTAILSASVSPDRQTVYLSALRDLKGTSPDGILDYSIERLNIGSDQLTTLSSGMGPAVSPNGRYLAYIRAPKDPPNTPPRLVGSGTEIAIRDLASGRQYFVRSPSLPGFPSMEGGPAQNFFVHMVTQASWSPTGSELALSVTDSDNAREAGGIEMLSIDSAGHPKRFHFLGPQALQDPPKSSPNLQPTWIHAQFVGEYLRTLSSCSSQTSCGKVGAYILTVNPRSGAIESYSDFPAPPGIMPIATDVITWNPKGSAFYYIGTSTSPTKRSNVLLFDHRGVVSEVLNEQNHSQAIRFVQWIP